MKKTLLKLLVIIMSLCFVVAFATGCGDNNNQEEQSETTLEFTLINNDTEYMVSACSENVSKVIIPSTYNGKPVVSIDYHVFYSCTSLTSIEIPNSITSIGDGAFCNCSSLKTVTFEENSKLTSIGYEVFRECESLTYIEIPNSVTSIGDFAFAYCISLRSIEISNNLTSIGIWAFDGCISLTSIEIPNSVTSIGFFAFHSCDSLTSIILPFIGETLNGTTNTHFSYIFGSNSFSFSDDYVPNSLARVVITGGEAISDYAFWGCSSLTSIEISNSVTSIGDYAFESCSSLTSIVIGNSVTWIGDYAFDCCYSLTSIKFNGTIAEWNSITKGDSWNHNVPATEVVCSDGKASLS